MSGWITGDVSSLETLTVSDHLYETHINQLRESSLSTAVVGQTSNCQYYGTTNSIIQTALDAVNTAGGGKVFIRKGTYAISADLTIYSNTILEGEGWGTILQAATGVTSIVEPDSLGSDNLIIKNIKFDSNEIATDCLLFGATDPILNDRILVTGCYFYNPTTAQKGNVQVFGNNIVFTNNFVENVWIVNMGFGNHQIFSNNYVKNTQDSCISMGSSYENDYYNWVVANNVLEKASGSNSGYNIDIYGDCQDVVVNGNTCVGAKLDNIFVHSGSKTGGGSVYPGPRISVVNNTCSEAGRAGISLSDSSTYGWFLIANNQIYSPVTQAIHIGANRTVVANNLCHSPSTTLGVIQIYGDASTSSYGHLITGNYVEGLISGKNVYDSVITDNRVTLSQLAGILFQGIQDSTISNNVIKNSGQVASAAQDDGILLEDGDFGVAGSINNIITGNRCFDDQGVKTQDTGIKTIGNADYNIISNNIVLGNLTGGISTVGSNNQIRNNIGWVTENSGTGTIASGATTAVVTHGLSVTPTLDDISITFGEQGTSDYGRWWVSNLTSTQFTLNVSVDPGVSALDFSWRAVVL